MKKIVLTAAFFALTLSTAFSQDFKPKEKEIKPVGSKETSDDDFATKITKAAIGVLTPIGLASSLFEEVERIKELLK
jgi:hypothetical protein